MRIGLLNEYGFGIIEVMLEGSDGEDRREAMVPCLRSGSREAQVGWRGNGTSYCLAVGEPRDEFCMERVYMRVGLVDIPVPAITYCTVSILRYEYRTCM